MITFIALAAEIGTSRPKFKPSSMQRRKNTCVQSAILPFKLPTVMLAIAKGMIGKIKKGQVPKQRKSKKSRKLSQRRRLK